MTRQQLLNNDISLEIIQTIIQHSDNSYLLRIALTEKLRDLLNCRLVVFVQYNIFEETEAVLSIEYAPDLRNRNQLYVDLNQIRFELLESLAVESIDNYNTHLESFSKFSKTILVPINYRNHHLATMLLFDYSKLYDEKRLIDTFQSISPYISTVLYNTISFNQMEQIINTRTKELKKVVDDLENANNAKSLFLANMSHEMRTPLNAIKGFLELLKVGDINTKQLDYISKMNQASNSLLHLISEILDYSKIQYENVHLEMETFHLKSVISDVLSFHEKKAEQKKIELKLSAEDLPSQLVKGDEERFKQILNNLLSNAIKFTNEGFVDIKVCTEIKMFKTDTKEIEKKLQFNCSVVDSGIGINKENQEKIFHIFTQEDDSTTRRFGGTGLGLSIVKRLIDAMGGDIDVDSEPGVGSTFNFHIFLELDEGCIDGDTRSGDSILDVGTIKQNINTPGKLEILVVEDNELNANLIKEVLKLRDYSCEFAENGSVAIKKTIAKHYDIIFMDCQMPLVDGYEATKIINSFYKETSITRIHTPFIIALTAAVSEEQKNKCFKAGMHDFIAKPINVNDIFNKIDEYQQKLLDT